MATQITRTNPQRSIESDFLRTDALRQQFELSTRTGSARSVAILDLLKIGQFDPRWSLPSQLARNRLAWLIEIDGLIIDARRIPRNSQEEAYRQGVIPFVPDENQ